MRGAGAVTALVLLQWLAGWAGAAAWTQAWGVVRRGHFRITAWVVLLLSLLTLAAYRASLPEEADLQAALILVSVVMAILYVMAQYLRSDMAGATAGALVGIAAVAALIASGSLIEGWPGWLAASSLVAGALFLGAIANGMMLGHWYLNQPGLKPWALARLTRLALVGVVVSALAGLIATPRLAGAQTPGAVLGLPGFGDNFAVAFFLIWVGLLFFSGVVVWMARRCVKIRSIQSATGLYYVALLTSGVSEFLVRYLMVNA